MQWRFGSRISRLRRPRDERGVMAIAIALITCFTIVPLAAYAVDIGVQRVARRDVQAVADLVALDLARQLDGRAYATLQPTMQALANKSAARNSAGSEVPTVTVQLGKLSDASWDASNPDAYFTAITSNAGGVPNAVKVTARTSVNLSISGDKGGAVRTSIARSQSNACFDIGSFAANLDSAHSTLLNSLINKSLNLSAISYQGLSNANITLGGLATQLGVGTPSALANDTVSLNQLYLASAKALQANGGEAADVTLLNSLATANFSTLPSVKIGDIFNIGSGSTAALDSSLNLLDLVSTSAFVANGSNALVIPSLTAGVPNVTGIASASLKVIQAPEGACGPVGTSVKTAQVSFDITYNLASLNILTLVASSTVTLHLSLAQALGTLSNVQCGTPEGFDVAVASALSQATTTLAINLKLLGLPIATVNVAAGTNAPAATNTVQFRHPPDAYGTAKSTGSGVALSTVTVGAGDVTVLGTLPITLTKAGIASSIMSTIVTPIVTPLVNNANSILVGPISDLLGLNLGGADVFPKTPTVCSDVKMAG